MSNIYNLEPVTKGKVLLYTSHGDIEIELWSREAPKACRNFVQLCMESYYDKTIFHRLVKGFCLQGGDPTGTGQGGDSIYGGDFVDEFHQRLKFIRRGLVAMANNGSPDSNGSQFFVTLGETPELQQKHTIFGKVSGNTIFNVLRMAELEVDSNERPLEPPMINRTEVLNNPFDDIQPRKSRHVKTEKKEKKKKSQMKATKNFKLLSFGDEAEEDEEETEQMSTKLGKIVSAHDATSDPKLSRELAVTTQQLEEDRSVIKTQAEQIRDKLKRELEVKPVEEVTPARQAKINSLRTESERLMGEIKGIGKAEKTGEQLAVDKDVNLNAEEKVTVNQFRKDLKDYKKMQGENKARSKSERQEKTMSALENFTNKLKSAPKEDAADALPEDLTVEAEEELLNSMNLFSHSLIDAESRTKVKDANVVTDDTYEIYDPRHPINKRKRGADKKGKDKEGGKWKRDKILT